MTDQQTISILARYGMTENGTPARLGTIAELRASAAPAANGIVFVDAAASFFYFSPFSQAADDGVTVIKPTALAVGRWLRSPIGLAQRVDTIAGLRAINGPQDSGFALLNGYTAAGDGGGGVFYFDAGFAAADNGGTVIAPDAGGGRWLRLHNSGRLYSKWFGAQSGAGDQTAAVQAAINAATPPAWIVIEPGVVYDVSAIVWPAMNLRLVDRSDPRFQRVISHASDGGAVEENEMIFGATYHPGLVLQNIDPRNSYSGSLVWRKGTAGGGLGDGIYQMGVDLGNGGDGKIGEGKPAWRLVQLMDAAGVPTEATRVMADEYGFLHAFMGMSVAAVADADLKDAAKDWMLHAPDGTIAYATTSGRLAQKIGGAWYQIALGTAL